MTAEHGHNLTEIVPPYMLEQLCLFSSDEWWLTRTCTPIYDTVVKFFLFCSLTWIMRSCFNNLKLHRFIPFNAYPFESATFRVNDVRYGKLALDGYRENGVSESFAWYWIWVAVELQRTTTRTAWRQASEDSNRQFAWVLLSTIETMWC